LPRISSPGLIITAYNGRWFASNYVGAKRVLGAPLDARHLLHLTKPGSSATAIRTDFSLPITIARLGESLGVAAAGTIAVRAGLARLLDLGQRRSPCSSCSCPEALSSVAANG